MEEKVALNYATYHIREAIRMVYRIDRASPKIQKLLQTLQEVEELSARNDNATQEDPEDIKAGEL